jgi:hypothetical protein
MNATVTKSRSIPWIRNEGSIIIKIDILSSRRFYCTHRATAAIFRTLFPFLTHHTTAICHPLDYRLSGIPSSGCKKKSPVFYSLLAFRSFEHGSSRLDWSWWVSLCLSVLKIVLNGSFREHWPRRCPLSIRHSTMQPLILQAARQSIRILMPQ